MLYVVVFLRSVVDKHYCGGIVCLMWQVTMLDMVVFLRSVVDKQYCGDYACCGCIFANAGG